MTDLLYSGSSCIKPLNAPKFQSLSAFPFARESDEDNSHLTVTLRLSERNTDKIKVQNGKQELMSNLKTTIFVTWENCEHFTKQE